MRIVLCLVLALFLSSSITLARDRAGEDRFSQRRVATMFAAQAALDVLGNMSSGRHPFDARRARIARRDLTAYMTLIPALFRRARMSPGSRALPAIWSDWSGFKDSANRAARTARSLNTRSLDRLRPDLSGMVTACLSCHRRYRRPP